MFREISFRIVWSGPLCHSEVLIRRRWYVREYWKKKRIQERSERIVTFLDDVFDSSRMYQESVLQFTPTPTPQIWTFKLEKATRRTCRCHESGLKPVMLTNFEMDNKSNLFLRTVSIFRMLSRTEISFKRIEIHEILARFPIKWYEFHY